MVEGIHRAVRVLIAVPADMNPVTFLHHRFHQDSYTKMLAFGVSNWGTGRDTNISVLLRCLTRDICTTIVHTSFTCCDASNKMHWYVPSVLWTKHQSRSTVYKNCVYAVLILLYVYIVICALLCNWCPTIDRIYNLGTVNSWPTTTLQLWNKGTCRYVENTIVTLDVCLSKNIHSWHEHMLRRQAFCSQHGCANGLVITDCQAKERLWSKVFPFTHTSWLKISINIITFVWFSRRIVAIIATLLISEHKHWPFFMICTLR